MADREIKPIWDSSSLLVYTGGLTVLGGAIAALVYLSTQYHGSGQGTAWTLLLLVILYGIATALKLRTDRAIAAGIFAFSSVILWIFFVLVDFSWWGWTHDDQFGNFHAWSWTRLAFLLLVLVAAWHDRRFFRFPFIRLISAIFFPILVVSVLPIGSNLTYIWLLLVGILYLFVGSVSDKPSTFWLHLVGGALIGIALLNWMHTSDTDYAVISFFSLLYVFIAYRTSRSSWAVFGTIGFFIATVHYLIGSPTQLVQGIVGASQLCSGLGGLGPTGLPGPSSCTAFGPQISPWSPALAFGLLGFWLVGLGILGKRKKGHKHTAVVVEQTTVIVETTDPPTA